MSRASGWAFGQGVALSNLARAAARAGRFEEAHRALRRGACACFEELSAERFKVEAMARRAECLVFEGRYREALDVANECREAAAKSPVGGVESLIERSIGYAFHQARQPEEGRPHFEESLRIARELKVQYEVALTLRAMAATRYPGVRGLRVRRATRSSSSSASCRCRACRCRSYATTGASSRPSCGTCAPRKKMNARTAPTAANATSAANAQW